MTALPAVTSTATIRALERAGFFVHHVKGSHHYLKHPERPTLRVTVPFTAETCRRGRSEASFARPV